MAKRITADGVNAYYGGFRAISDVTLTIEPKSVTALIGPSGCGKSTFLRTLNRMHEVIPGARVEGKVLLDDEDLYDDVAAGLRLNGIKGKGRLEEAVERSLRSANLWTEVKDRLGKPGAGLSGGQQQRLCIARAIAVEPQVLLMDEPCSSLDPISTLAIEDLMTELKDRYTIVIVTHNMQQAARVSDATGFFTIDGPGQAGRLVEVDATEKIFSNPTEKRTEDYITGRFG